MNNRGSKTTLAFFIAAVLGAALAPLASHVDQRAQAAADSFPGWPAGYEERELTALPLTSLEEVFARDFPGRVGRFWDGRRELIVRWVAEPTRRLHSAADCFRGSGYNVTPVPVRKDAAGRSMGCFRASRGPESLTVCEVIYDANARSWSDVSAWYWHTLFDSTRAPWWSYVVAERS